MTRCRKLRSFGLRSTIEKYPPSGAQAISQKARNMNDENEYNYFKLRKQTKTYISKIFTFNEQNPERVRQVRMVIEGNDRVHLGEIEGAMCLRVTGNVRKTQVTALITQDEKKIKRL